MRNWNSFIMSRLSGKADRFEPTYEELKLSSCGRISKIRDVIWAYLWGIETRLRIYKKKSGEKIWAYLWGIETYICPLEKTSYTQDLSLPMRNWNHNVLHNFPLSKKIWAYLWGIETFWITFPWGWKPDDLSLPMRNWNCFPKCCNCGAIYDLSLPMRNWNSTGLFSSPIKRDRFEPTYEELKLFGKRGNEDMIRRFEPTYEELKLASMMPHQQAPQRFEPTYEELKLGVITANIHFILRFEPTYKESKSPRNIHSQSR